MTSRIFHYTSFETFKLIIKNKTIRFNSLKNVDDYEEGLTTDVGHKSQYFFASCWTRDDEESIPLWTMYVKDRFAVRIEIDSNFIYPEINKNHQIINHTNDNACCYPIIREGGKPEFFSDVVYQEEPKVNMFLNYYGMISPEYIKGFCLLKRKSWAFQKECRFLLQASPKSHSYRRSDEIPYWNHYESIVNNDPTDIEFIDVLYDSNKMKKANFMLGPSTTAEDFNEFILFINETIDDFEGDVTRSKVLIRPR